MPDIVNLQRKVKLDLASVREFVANLPSVVTESNAATFAVAFISDERMKKLNSTFCGKDSTTDVLSFPHESDQFAASTDFGRQPPKGGTPNEHFLGDIVISAEQAQKQAAENGLSLDNEIKQLILHGLLHLCGYDHETDDGEMDDRELELRRMLNI